VSIHDYIYLKYTISLNDSIIFVNNTGHDIAIKTQRSTGDSNMVENYNEVVNVVELEPEPEPRIEIRFTPDVSGIFFFQSTSAFHMYGEIEVV
jgi:hypothetical protein